MPRTTLSRNRRTFHRRRGRSYPWSHRRRIDLAPLLPSPSSSGLRNASSSNVSAGPPRQNAGWLTGPRPSSWPLTAGAMWPSPHISTGTGPGCRSGAGASLRTGWRGSGIDRAAAVRRDFSPLQQAQIVALACTPPAEVGRAWVRWSVRALHDEIERRQIATLHPSTVHHILTDADLHPHQVRYWRHALAEDFEAKAASVLWYYERVAALADRGELVVCLDEKPNIQALGRTIPDLPPAPGYALRRNWEYVRHGTVNLLVIYNLLTGQLWGRVLARNDAAHFIPALEAYLAELPWEIRCVHCILDQGASHIAKTTREWIAAQEGLVRLHFTPAHASWLNQAELALSAFSRRYLRDRVTESRRELITHIYRSVGEYNSLHAHPFRWSFTRHAMHQWYCRRTWATVH